jgi:hypothetical protein
MSQKSGRGSGHGNTLHSPIKGILREEVERDMPFKAKPFSAFNDFAIRYVDKAVQVRPW